MSVGGPPLTERYPELSASSRSWRSHEQRPELLPRRLMSTGATGGMLYTWYWADCCSVDEGPPLGASSMQRAATIKAVAGARRRGCRRRGAWCRLPDQPSARAPINGRERRCTCPPVACWATARPSPTGIAARTPPSCRVSPDAWRHSQPVWQVRRLPQHPAPAPGRQTRVGHQNHSSSHPPCHWPEQLAHVNRLFMWLGCCIGGSDSPEAMKSIRPARRRAQCPLSCGARCNTPSVGALCGSAYGAGVGGHRHGRACAADPPAACDRCTVRRSAPGVPHQTGGDTRSWGGRSRAPAVAVWQPPTHPSGAPSPDHRPTTETGERRGGGGGGPPRWRRGRSQPLATGLSVGA